MSASATRRQGYWSMRGCYLPARSGAGHFRGNARRTANRRVAQPQTTQKPASGKLPYLLANTWTYSRLRVNLAVSGDTYGALLSPLMYPLYVELGGVRCLLRIRNPVDDNSACWRLAAAALRHAFECGRPDRTISVARPANTVSIRSMGKPGLKLEYEFESEWRVFC